MGNPDEFDKAVGDFKYLAIERYRVIEVATQKLTARAITDTYNQMYEDNESWGCMHKYFSVWIKRPAFYLLLANHIGVSIDRCIGILHANWQLRKLLDIPPHIFTAEESETLWQISLLNGARDSTLVWLGGITRCAMCSHRQQVSGTTYNEPNSSDL